MAQLVIDNASKVFLDPQGQLIWAVRDVTLEVADGGLLVLVGPSGCGKTTLLRVIAGLEEVTRGTIAIGGQAMNQVPPGGRNVAMVFQNLALFPHLTAFENMALGLKLRKEPASQLTSKVREVAAWLGLTECLGRRPGQLSGGERQRVALGRALVRNPSLLLLDEPFSNLDAPWRAQLRAEVTRWQARARMTTICVTHDQTDAFALGERIAVMNDGLIQQVADPTALYSRPANLFVAEFLGPWPMNLLRGMIRSERGRFVFAVLPPRREPTREPWLVDLPAEGRAGLTSLLERDVVLGLRPEHLRLRPGPGASTAGSFTAVVERTELAGLGICLRLRVAGHALTARAPDSFKIEPDETVAVELDTRWARFFDATSGQALEAGPAPAGWDEGMTG